MYEMKCLSLTENAWLLLPYQAVIITIRISTLLLELGVLYALEPRGLQDPDKDSSKRQKRSKRSKTTESNSFCAACCAGCKRRAEIARRRAAMLKHVEEEAVPEEISHSEVCLSNVVHVLWFP